MQKHAYNPAEAAAAFSFSRSTLYAAISQGRLRSHRVGGRRVILHEDMMKFVTGKS